MKKIVVIAISVIIIGMMIDSVNAASLAYIDYQKIFSTYNKAKKGQEQVKKQMEKLQDEVTKKQEQIEKEKKNGMANDELRNLASKIQKDIDLKKGEIKALLQKLENEIRDDIVKTTDEVAKKTGIETVLFKDAFVTGGIDITDKVIDQLKKKKN